MDAANLNHRPDGPALLDVEGLRTGYGKCQVLSGISLKLRAGEIAALLGGNGTGKSTFLRVIAGFVRPWAGQVLFQGAAIDQYAPHEVGRLGVGYLMQGGRVFQSLSVMENVRLVCGNRNGETLDGDEDTWIFGRLHDLRQRRAGMLSGGERQMLAVEMLLRRRCQLLLLDEPSAGLAPKVTAELFAAVKAIARQRMCAVLLAEQNVQQALEIADRAWRLEAGTLQRVEYARG